MATDSTIPQLKNRLKHISDAFVDRWFKLHSDWPADLWHYTNAGGLLGILQGNQLWFSDASFLNDASEMSYAVDLAEQIINEKLRDPTLAPLVQEYLSALVLTIVNQRNHIKEYAFVNPTFVSCFCEEPDSLHLWRAYTDHGSGFSIGLFPHFIAQKLQPIRLLERAVSGNKLIETWHPFRPFICRVIYDEKEQTMIISGLLNSLIDGIERAPMEFPSGNINNVHKTIVSSTFFRLFYLCLVCFKHPSFKDEREWRLIYAPEFASEDDISEYAPVELHYRQSGSYFVPYLKIDVGNLKEVELHGVKSTITTLAFETVFAGPGLDVRLARASFNAYVLRNGYLGSMVGVKASRVPPRSL